MTTSMRDDDSPWTLQEKWMAAGIMALMGGFYWAIRGTGGYGGETGGTLAGFGWALLWVAFSHADGRARPYGSPWILVAITGGIAFGGLTGYGVYISWINGEFHLNHPELWRSVPAWTGYSMLFICGLHWGGNTGCFMAWCAPSATGRPPSWTARLACGVVAGLLASAIVRIIPSAFLPFFRDGIYAIPEHKTCARALDSLHTIAPHVGTLVGFLCYEAFRRDWRAVRMISIMALGFALPFAIGGVWHTFRDSPLKIGWWKNWEMTIGLGGGLAFGLAFMSLNGPDRSVQPALSRRSGALFRSGLPLWLPSLIVIKGCYDGWAAMRSQDPSGMVYGALILLSLMPYLVGHVLRRAEGKDVPLTQPYRLSTSSFVILQLLIVSAGLVVSMPLQWHLANIVLVGLYGFYLTVSLGLSFLLLRSLRRGKSPGGYL